MNVFVNFDVCVVVEFNNSLPELLCSDDDSGNEDGLDMEYSEAETEELKKNAEVSLRPSVWFEKWQFSGHGFNDRVMICSVDWRASELIQTHQCGQSHRQQFIIRYWCLIVWMCDIDKNNISIFSEIVSIEIIRLYFAECVIVLVP